MEVSSGTVNDRMVLAHFIVSDDVERRRRFYSDVLGGKTVIGGGRDQAGLPQGLRCRSGLRGQRSWVASPKPS